LPDPDGPWTSTISPGLRKDVDWPPATAERCASSPGMFVRRGGTAFGDYFETEKREGRTYWWPGLTSVTEVGRKYVNQCLWKRSCRKHTVCKDSKCISPRRLSVSFLRSMANVVYAVDLTVPTLWADQIRRVKGHSCGNARYLFRS
jgi:hypothetical protein